MRIGAAGKWNFLRKIWYSIFPQNPVVKTGLFFIHYLGAHGKQMDFQQMDVLIWAMEKFPLWSWSRRWYSTFFECLLNTVAVIAGKSENPADQTILFVFPLIIWLQTSDFMHKVM